MNPVPLAPQATAVITRPWLCSRNKSTNVICLVDLYLYHNHHRTKNRNVTARKCSDNCNSCNFFRQNVSFDVIKLKRAKQARAKRARATCSLRICEGYAGSKFCGYSLFLALAGSRYFDSQLNKCKLTRENYKNNSGSVCKCE